MAAASLEEQNLQAVGIPGPDFPHGPQGVEFCGAATHLEEPSRQWEFGGLISHMGFWKFRPMALLPG
jgi:hypothetical protein